MADWAPIATAPRDTRDFLAILPGGRQLVVRWHPPAFAFVAVDGQPYAPTQWQVLPDPPLEQPAPPPGPVLTALDPPTAALGDPPFTLHIHGSGFTPDATIYWNNVAEPTFVVSDAEVTTTIDMSTAQVAMPIPVEVATDAGRSNALTFELTEAAEATGNGPTRRRKKG